MSKQIIDSVEDLMKLPDAELTEKLLEEKYNKANLRELIRRSLKEVKTYKDAFEYQCSLREELEEKEEGENRKKEPPRPNIPDLEPRWSFGRKD